MCVRQKFDELKVNWQRQIILQKLYAGTIPAYPGLSGARFLAKTPGKLSAKTAGHHDTISPIIMHKPIRTLSRKANALP